MTYFKTVAMKINVFKILKSPIGTNSHSVSRSEEWEFKLCESFESVTDAKKFIMSESKFLPDFVRITIHLSVEEKEKFISSFCFDFNPLYSLYQKFVLEQDKQRLVDAVKSALKINNNST